jgi:hypothetical protein
MVKWYLATYQNGAFVSDLGIIQSSGDYAYKLKDAIDSGESPKKEDWLRITIADNKVEEWDTDNNDWVNVTSLTGLVNGSVYWVYGSIVKYVIVTNSQTYYLESFSNDENGIITGKDINDSDVSIDVTAITAVTIGPSVTTIGYRAFYGCTSLKSVIIPDSVTKISNGVFAGCTSLASVTIPDSVTEIGDDAFADCRSLASLKIGEKVETIGQNAFANCLSLAFVIIPDSVTEIGDSAFRECTKLLTLIIPDSVTSIGDNAFVGIGDFSNNDPIITISQSTVRRLMESDSYYSGNQYTGETFFGTTEVTFIVT